LTEFVTCFVALEGLDHDVERVGPDVGNGLLARQFGFECQNLVRRVEGGVDAGFVAASVDSVPAVCREQNGI
jgi:hypothetical protein